ncbi:MAG: putative Histidine kinase [Promethearchaeota archaeon]|nr:MAG: putative Histidine kinase [Candidatus Lokiarchaeota archaeon]
MNSVSEDESKLLENTEIFKHIFNKNKLAILLFNPIGNLLYANNSFFKLFNISKNSDFKDKLFFSQEIAPNLEKNNIQKLINICKYVQNISSTSCHADLRFFNLNISRFILKKKEKKIYIVEIEDNTELQSLEQKLINNRKKFQLIADNSKEAIFIIDDNYKFTYVNKKLSDILGYSKAEIIGEDFRKYLDEETKDLVIERYRKRQKGEPTKPQYEFKVITNNGEKRTLEITALATRELGNRMRSIGQAIDITDRRKVEQDLEETEERFNILGQHSMSIIIVQENRIIYANEHFQKAFGIMGEQKRENNLLKFISLVHPEDREFVAQKLEITSEKKFNKPIDFHFRMFDKNKQIAWKAAYVNQISYQSHKAKLITLIDITEQKNAELALKESEQEKALMVNSISEHFVFQDLQHNVIFANEAAKKSLPPNTEIEGKKCYTLWNNLESSCPGCPTEKAIETGKIEENKIETSDGRFWHIKGFPVKGENQQIIGVVEVTKDITDTKKAEKALKESENKFRIITEQSFMGIAILQDHQFKYVNKRFSEIIGASIKEILNWRPRRHYYMIHPDDFNETVEIFEQKYRGEIDAVQNLQFRLISQRNKIIWVEIFSKTISYQGGEADLVSMIDITVQKEAERKLKESEQKFRGIVNSIPDAFFLVNDETTVLDYKSEADILLLDPKDFLYNKLNKLLPEELGNRTEKTIMKVLQTKKPQIIEYSLPFDSTVLYFEARFFYYSKEEVAIFIRNISERKEAEQMIKEEVRRLKELDQMRKDLISRVSHELKTPIMAISGAIEYILECYNHSIDKEVVDLIRMIQNNETRLEILIENLLDISRMEHGKIILKKRRYYLKELIMNSVNELEYLIRSRKLGLTINVPNDISFKVDKIRMEQVFINLLSNAIKNTPPRGSVVISAETKNDNTIQITFSDTGVGLKEDEIDRLFTQFGKIERFGEGLEYLDISGSGLGLFISRQILKLHQGTIIVESEGRNKGSTFSINLPLE